MTATLLLVSTKSLPKDQLAHARRKVQALVDEQFPKSVAAAAIAMKVKQSSLSEFLNGKAGIGIVNLQRIAAFAGCSVDDLLRDSPAPARTVEYTDRYIQMRNVRQVARDEGYPEDFIASFDPALDYDGQPPFDLLWNLFKAEYAQRKGKLITHPVVGDL